MKWCRKNILEGFVRKMEIKNCIEFAYDQGKLSYGEYVDLINELDLLEEESECYNKMIYNEEDSYVWTVETEWDQKLATYCHNHHIKLYSSGTYQTFIGRYNDLEKLHDKFFKDIELNLEDC